MSIITLIYRCALGLLPGDFKARYAHEMLGTFRERVHEANTWRTGVGEVGGVVVTALRLRARPPFHAMIAGVAVTSFLMLFLYQRSGPRVDFSATDPAGQFTLSIRRGKPVAATMSGVSLPLRRIRQTGDSIRFLQADGKVALTVAYDRESSSLAWAPRPGALR